MRSECGTRGRNDTLRSRAASGNYARPALRPVCEITLAGLGQEGAGNARLVAHDLTGKPVTTFPDHALKKRTVFRTRLFEALGSLRPTKSQEVRIWSWSCGGRSLQQEPRWNADRRACPAGYAPHREMRRLAEHVCRRSASFFLSSLRFVGAVARSETHRSAWWVTPLRG